VTDEIQVTGRCEEIDSPSIWRFSNLVQNVCRRLSDRLWGILVRFVLGELAAHSFSEFFHIVLTERSPHGEGAMLWGGHLKGQGTGNLGTGREVTA
jgi:hypothetical protein